MAVDKDLLTTTLNGESIMGPNAHPILTSLRAEGSIVRWLAVSVLPDLHDRLCAAGNRQWPEAMVFHHLWTAAEDACLEAWARFCLAKTPAPTHLSLHHDGLRIDATGVADKGQFMQDAMECIRRETGVSCSHHGEEGVDRHGDRGRHL